MWKTILSPAPAELYMQAISNSYSDILQSFGCTLLNNTGYNRTLVS